MEQTISPRRAGTRRGAGLVAAITVVACAAWIPAVARACDLCAIYSATELRQSRTGLQLGIAEQFTSYNTLQRDGEEVANPAGEWMNSFITQLVVGYRLKPRIGLQLNVPLISRYFRRQEASGVVHGDETGIGDMSLLGNVEAYGDVTENGVIRLTLLGGLKLPSGNSRRIKEELAEPSPAGTAAAGIGLHHGGAEQGSEEVASGIHGHDLALGSGSVDGVLGAHLFWSWKRAFVTGSLQYLLRTEGDFSYQYANDLIWSGGPGAFALVSHDYTLGVQAVISGESKGNDSLNGVKSSDTAITALYVGPGFLFTWGTSLGADLAADIPVVQNNSSLQIVPDYRLRGGVTWSF